MKLKKILEVFKEELNDNDCKHDFIIIIKKSHVLSVGFVSYGICLNCNEYVTFRDDYDYNMNRGFVIDATLKESDFEIFESSCENIDNDLLNDLKTKYNKIKNDNSKEFVKEELEKIISEYKIRKIKRL